MQNKYGIPSPPQTPSHFRFDRLMERIVLKLKENDFSVYSYYPNTDEYSFFNECKTELAKFGWTLVDNDRLWSIKPSIQ